MPNRDVATGRAAAFAAGEVLAFLLLVLLVYALTGCATTCDELNRKAEARGCAERVVTETVEVFEPLDLGPIPAPPPLTAAELDPATVDHETALEALLADLANSRAWGFELFEMLRALEAARAATADGG